MITLSSPADDLAVTGTIVFPETGRIVVALITEEEFNARALSSENPYVLTIEPDAQQSYLRQAAFAFRRVQAGRYTVGCYQDVNGNRQLDVNLLGMPKEPWGVYRLQPSFLHAPDFAEVAFSVPGDVTRLEIRIK